MILWSIFFIFKILGGSVLAISWNESCDYQLSEIYIESFHLDDHTDQRLGLLEFQQPYIRIKFLSYNQEFVMNLQKLNDLPNTPVSLEVKGIGDDFIIDYVPPVYKTMKNSSNTGEAIGLYDRRTNTFIGIVISGNVTYYLEPAKYHFLNYRADNRALLVSKTHRSFNISDNINVDDGFTRRMCEIGIVSDHTLLDKLDNNFTVTVGWAWFHVLHTDLIFKYEIFGSNIFRIFPSRVTFDLERYTVDYTSMGSMLWDFHLTNDDFCISALLTSRYFSQSNAYGMANTGQLCYKRPPRGYRQFNKFVATLYSNSKLAPLCLSSETFAHEVGHMFGSNHDPEAIGGECTPDEYHLQLMYPRAHPHCDRSVPRFSICSVREITEHLEIILPRIENCLKKIQY